MMDRELRLRLGHARYGVVLNAESKCEFCGKALGEGSRGATCAACEKNLSAVNKAENLVEAPTKAECAWCAHTKAEHIGGSCKQCNCRAKFNSENEAENNGPTHTHQDLPGEGGHDGCPACIKEGRMVGTFKPRPAK